MPYLGLFSVRIYAQRFEYLVSLDEGLYRLVGMRIVEDERKNEI